MIGYRFLSPSEEEMAESAQYYENAAIGLGANFLDDIQRAINRLREQPRLGEVISGDLRRTLLTRFPFSIIYAIGSEEILIVAVAHQRRRPGYWKGRVGR